MLILAYSRTSGSTIQRKLGTPEYSYYFVLREFLPVLERVGQVVVVESIEEIDPLYEKAVASGESCVLLSFTAPHRTPTGLACPTIPVFAWEYDTIPDENWDDCVSDDWTAVLRKLGCAITHSQYAVEAIRRSMGPDFPVISITAPVWDRFEARRRDRQQGPVIADSVQLRIDGTVIDSRTADLGRYAPHAVFMSPHQREEIPERRKTMVEQFEHAVSIVVLRDAQLQKRNQDCAYAESVIRKRDVQIRAQSDELDTLRERVRDLDARVKLLAPGEASFIGRILYFVLALSRELTASARRFAGRVVRVLRARLVARRQRL